MLLFNAVLNFPIEIDNDLPFAGVVEREYMLHQLKACGVIETVSISQAGYPVRWEIYDKYWHNFLMFLSPA